MWSTQRVSSGWQRMPMLLLANLFILFVGCQAAYVFDAYRLVQMDVKGESLGSRSVRLNQYANLPMEGAKLFRSVVVIPFSQATAQIVSDLLEEKNGISGLLFVLPQNLDNGAVDDEAKEKFSELEEVLLSRAIPVPVYFAKENDDIKSMVDEIETNIRKGNPPGSAKGGYMMMVKGADMKPIKEPRITNYEAWMPGSGGGRQSNPHGPTIAVTAHYDTFAAAPGLAVGAGSNGSGLLAILSLIRMFDRLYSSDESRPKPNLVFLLTGGGKLDSVGLQEWLKSAHNRLLDSLEVVICLDSLSGWGAEGDDLYLHYSKPSKDPLAKVWYDRFQVASEKEGVKLEQVHKKVNLALPYKPWGHEHIAEQKIFALTLSGRDGPVAPMHSSSLLDQPGAVNLTKLSQAVRIAAEVVAMRLYSDRGEDLHVFEENGPFDVNMKFLELWLGLLGKTGRMPPFFTSKSPLNAAILKVFMDHSGRGTNSTFKLDDQYRFYHGEAFPITVYKTAGAMFDVFLAIGVALYLASLFVVLRVVTQGWDELVAIFKAPSKKRRKVV